MSDFADVEQFARQHAACGGITPSAAPEAGGGFVLTLTCACGVTFHRQVTLEEAKRPLPLPPRPAPRRPPAAPTSPDLQAAVRAALDAEAGAGPVGPAPGAAAVPPPPASSDELEALMRQALAAESGAPAAGDARGGPAPPAAVRPPSSPPPGARPGSGAPAPARAAPARLNLDATIRTALTQQAELGTGKPAAARPGTRVVWLALFALAALGSAAGLYFAAGLEAPAEAPVAPVATAAAPPLDQRQRAALDEVVKSLHDLQAISTPHTSLSVYSSRVIFAKTDVERFLTSAPPGPHRTAVREALSIHLLAAAAWRARTLEQKEQWEAVAQDPAIELCPSVKGVVDFAAQPENVPRAQSRGAAVASAIPLLWECAAEKIAEIDRGLAAR